MSPRGWRYASRGRGGTLGHGRGQARGRGRQETTLPSGRPRPSYELFMGNLPLNITKRLLKRELEEYLVGTFVRVVELHEPMLGKFACRNDMRRACRSSVIFALQIGRALPDSRLAALVQVHASVEDCFFHNHFTPPAQRACVNVCKRCVSVNFRNRHMSISCNSLYFFDFVVPGG